tara:strand:+ start:11632 stop:11793 length:162 start_codon:yes stop_codon:yes gene_type:complete
MGRTSLVPRFWLRSQSSILTLESFGEQSEPYVRVVFLSARYPDIVSVLTEDSG